MQKPTLPICYRNGANGKLEITDVPYDGLLEGKTMRRVNMLFLEKAASGYFFPLEPLDAYHDVWLELEHKAENLPGLAKASEHTYLCGVARLMFLNWFKRKVEPARKMYRQLEDRHHSKNGAVGIDDFDIDNYDATEGAPSVRMAAATDRGEDERLYEPSDHSDCEQEEALALPDSNRKWKDALTILLNALDDDTAVRAFVAYVKANGNFIEAAALAGIPKTTFYRKWPTWIAAAKKVGKKCGLCVTN